MAPEPKTLADCAKALLQQQCKHAARTIRNRAEVLPDHQDESWPAFFSRNLPEEQPGRDQRTYLLALKATSSVEGDIVTDKLSIEPGASFTGNCNMGGKVKELTQPDAGTQRQEAAV